MRKPKRCKVCEHQFIPVKAMQSVCGPHCAVKYAEALRAKDRARESAQDRRETRAKLEARKTRSEVMREAQAAFNTFIRLRDRLAGHPCISSGRPLDWSGNQVDAGHYRSTGAAPHLRFDESNCHAQSKQDNRYLAGNSVGYRIRLIERIGLAEVERLESDNAPRHWSVDDLRQIRDTYRAKARVLKKQIEK